MPLQALDPIEALHRLTGRWQPRRPVRTPIEGALGKRLAAPLAIPPRRSAEGLLRATLNGYVLRPGQGAGEYGYSMASGDGTEAPAASGDGGAGEGSAPVLERVETGDILPQGIERVVPVEWTVVVASPAGATPRVRIPEDALPPPGHGMAGPGQAAEEVERGTWIGPRLLALLLSREVASVETYPALRIGILAIGNELTDILGDPAPGAAPTRDLSGLWLPHQVRALGHLPHSLGIIGSDPLEGRETFLRARRVGLDAIIITGGLGDGPSDRTAELILRTGGKIAFDGVAIQPGRRFLSGDTVEMRILCLGGQPLDASAGFDLFLRPALLSSHGAPGEAWDWSRTSFPAVLVRERPEALSREVRVGPGGPPLWSAIPVARDPSGSGLSAIARPASQTAHLPWIPGQSGWAILPPSGSGHPREGRAYYQSCEVSGELGFGDEHLG